MWIPIAFATLVCASLLTFVLMLPPLRDAGADLADDAPPSYGDFGDPITALFWASVFPQALMHGVPMLFSVFCWLCTCAVATYSNCVQTRRGTIDRLYTYFYPPISPEFPPKRHT